MSHSDILENRKFRPSTRPQLSAMTADATLSASRPKRVPTASGKLLDASNSAAPALSAHKNAIEAKRLADEAATASKRQATASSTLSVASQADLAVPALTPLSLGIADTQQISSDSDLESQRPHKFFDTRHIPY